MKKILFAAAIALSIASLRAGTEGYVMLSVCSPGQLPAPTSSIYGGRLSLIYGECHELYGLDLGVTGYVRERLCGAQLNGLWSGVGTDMAGLQVGAVNTVDGYGAGLQVGAMNFLTELYGCQIGLSNVAFRDVYGCQIGLVNVADSLYGCQIGLLNFCTDRNWSFWPIINIGW